MNADFNTIDRLVHVYKRFKRSDSEIIVAKLFVRNNWRDVSTFKGDELSSNKIVINFDGNEKNKRFASFIDVLRTASYLDFQSTFLLPHALRAWPKHVHHKSKMADSCHLGKIAISQRRLDRSPRDLAQ